MIPGLTCPVCQGVKACYSAVCSPRCGDTALRLAAEVRAERTPTAPVRPVAVIGPPDGCLRLSDDYPPTPEAGTVTWLSVTPEPAVAEPPQRTDRAWRRALARAGGGRALRRPRGGRMTAAARREGQS